MTGFVGPCNLGWVAGAGASYRCFPDDPERVRRACVSYHVLARLTTAQVMAEGHCTVVPDLVVEVISPNDLADDVNEKLGDWLDAGAKLVWIIHPVQQTVHTYRADGTVHRFTRLDTLTAAPVLPEFRVAVADLFRMPQSAVKS